jgi:hypothetical protein
VIELRDQFLSKEVQVVPDYFKFTSDSPYIQPPKITQNEFTGIHVWQRLWSYEFSFHTQHEAGWPVYIVETGKRGQRDRPKINVKDKTSEECAILNGQYWDDVGNGEEAKQVVIANWQVFQKLASLYYEGANNAQQVRPPGPKALFVCLNPGCRREVTIEFVNSFVKSRHIQKMHAMPGRSIGTNAEVTIFRCPKCEWHLDYRRDLNPGEQSRGEKILVEA